MRSFSTGRSVAEVAPGSVRVITANGASADGARSTSYTSGAVTGLPSVSRAGGRQESFTSRSPGSARRSDGGSGAARNVTESRRDGGLVWPSASAVRTT